MGNGSRSNEEYSVYENIVNDGTNNMDGVQMRILLYNAKRNEGLLFEERMVTFLEASQTNKFIKQHNFHFKFKCHACMGIFNICDEDFISDYVGFITEKATIGKVGGITYEKIKNVTFLPMYVTETYTTIKNDTIPNSTPTLLEQWVKFFSTGNFYYAHRHDQSQKIHYINISQSLQVRMECQDKFSNKIDNSKAFLWNRGARLSFYIDNSDQWIIYLICGSIVVDKILISTCQVNLINNTLLSSSSFNNNGVESEDNFTRSISMVTKKPDTHKSNNLSQQNSSNSSLHNILNTTNSYDNEPSDSYIHTSKKCLTLMLISRLGWQHENFNRDVRGVDDYGNVSNFIETEQIIEYYKSVTSFVQIRGSVPLFWKQISTGQGDNKKIEFTRSLLFSCYAMHNHMKKLKSHYGQVRCVSLLSKKTVENELSHHYNKIFNKINTLNIKLLNYDYNEHYISNGNKEEFTRMLYDNLTPYLSSVQFFWASIDAYGNFVKHIGDQLGVIRTNCFDCLDRTNNVQSLLAIHTLQQQLKSLNIPSIDVAKFDEISEILKVLWEKNNAHCCKIFQGTSTIDIQPNKNKAGIIKANAIHVKRRLKQLFHASSSKHAIMIQIQAMNFGFFRFDSAIYSLIGSILPREFVENSILPPSLINDLLECKSQYTHDIKLTITVASWNINGGIDKNGSSIMFQDLQNWILYPQRVNPQYIQSKLVDITLLEKPSDIYIVGFQETIDLNASSVLKNTSESLTLWNIQILETINHYSRNQQYVLVGKRQLVGISILVYIKECHARYVKEITIDEVKTGFGGKYGNKGAVSISFILYNTSVCFVVSHLCAGPGPSKCDERNSNFNEITRKLEFNYFQSFYDHDIIFWAGDLNYRIDLPYYSAKSLAHGNNYKSLLRRDQLINEIKQKNVFHGFKEGNITFPPTYKFDLGTNIYDTSEKKRTPSYTDRILWWIRPSYSNNSLHHKGCTVSSDYYQSSPSVESRATRNSQVTCLYYGCGYANVSDHKPIVSKLAMNIKETDTSKLYPIIVKLIEDFGYICKNIQIKPTIEYIHLINSSSMKLLAQNISSHINNIEIIKVYDDHLNITLNSAFKIDDLPSSMIIDNVIYDIVVIPCKTFIELDRDALKILEIGHKNNTEIDFSATALNSVMSSCTDDSTDISNTLVPSHDECKRRHSTSFYISDIDILKSKNESSKYT